MKSLLFEFWANPYEEIPPEKSDKGRLIIITIKALRNIKSTLKMPLNQEISRVVISTKNSTLLQLDQLVDIKETLRINEFEVINSTIKSKIPKKFDHSESNEDLGGTIFISK